MQFGYKREFTPISLFYSEKKVEAKFLLAKNEILK